MSPRMATRHAGRRAPRLSAMSVGPVALAAVALLLASPLFAQRSDGLGNRGAALRPCDDHMDHGRRQQGRACYLELLNRNSPLGVQAEAWWGVGDFKQANEVFRAAVAAEPENPDLRVRWGYLFLETYNPGEAFKLFEEALGIDENHLAAKLGKAQVIGDRFEGKALEQVEEIIKADPDFYEAYLLKARMALEEKDVEKAEEALDKAAEIAAASKLAPLDIYAMRASIDLLNDKTESEWTAKALAYNPSFGRIYAEPAHFYVITRRYREAVNLLQKAVKVDPELWSAHAELAVNLMREDRDDEAKRHLEIAFKAARQIDVGGVMINDAPTFRADQQPYGGRRESGVGLEGVRYAIHELTQPKFICLNLPKLD